MHFWVLFLFKSCFIFLLTPNSHFIFYTFNNSTNRFHFSSLSKLNTVEVIRCRSWKQQISIKRFFRKLYIHSCSYLKFKNQRLFIPAIWKLTAKNYKKIYLFLFNLIFFIECKIHISAQITQTYILFKDRVRRSSYSENL